MQSLHERDAYPAQSPLVGSELKLELGNRLSRVETLGARPGAVKDGVAPVQTHLVLELLLALHLVGITRISNPSVGRHERRGAKVDVLIPPITWARRRAAGAQDAFVHARGWTLVGRKWSGTVSKRRTRRASSGPLVTARTRDPVVGYRSAGRAR